MICDRSSSVWQIASVIFHHPKRMAIEDPIHQGYQSAPQVYFLNFGRSVNETSSADFGFPSFRRHTSEF
jgi:hypothetical protein